MRPFARTKLVTLFLALGLALDAHARAQLPAFPGAVGFGASATGGRGGAVLHVTTLAASGQGSLAWATSQAGPRIIVFDVSGVIEGDVEITHGDVTIAGQTAPGAGITINGHLFTPYGDVVSNIIVRFVRVRPNGTDATWTPAGHDAIQMSDVDRAIFDHVDASHGIDEIVDHWNGATNVTWQRSVLAFPNPAGGHPDGAHPFCLINSEGEDGAPNGGRITITGNLFAHCRTRTPALGVGPAEVIGNVVYDGREGFVHHNAAYGDFFIAGNVYIDGPSNTLLPLWFDPENDDPPTRYFLADNLVEDPVRARLARREPVPSRERSAGLRGPGLSHAARAELLHRRVCGAHVRRRVPS
jgi:pectate lyase